MCDGESQLREVRPSSLVARMMMSSVSNGRHVNILACSAENG